MQRKTVLPTDTSFDNISPYSLNDAPAITKTLYKAGLRACQTPKTPFLKACHLKDHILCILIKMVQFPD